MTDDGVYFNDGQNRVTRMRESDVDEIVTQDGMTHLEMLTDESAYLGVEVDGETRQFSIHINEDGKLAVTPYENLR